MRSIESKLEASNLYFIKILILISVFFLCLNSANALVNKPRIIATTDGEIDYEYPMVRILLNAKEFEIGHAESSDISVVFSNDFHPPITRHIIFEVIDNGYPKSTCNRHIIIHPKH